MKRVKTRRFTAFLGLLSGLLAVSALTPAAAAAVPAAADCPTTGTFCAWDGQNYQGGAFTARPLKPGSGTCVDLAAHGWGNRIRSAINTNAQAATLFSNANCTGAYHPISGGARVPSISFSASSVLVS